MEQATPMTPEKKPRRPLGGWLLPLFFILVGAWYIIEWGTTTPRTLTFRFGAGVVLVLYGGWRLARFWRHG
ncbi:MAG: hypothetical protein SNJ67_02045 [Chloracidobacterium sp.]|uniref:Uncharacterized protein n=1 Tax=Chloracidobacterium validum TaxID=2821543 RepID=A0ABX8B670_9BACT|nr:hypothetical protein [Chloracidobacterium validum]QUW02472.1 hypothetical protein J8C06_08945 [Chloracidobacterium validum]